MHGRLFLGLAIGAVVAAMIAGLLIVGGPFQARRDRFDTQRLLELDRLAHTLLCVQAPRLQDLSLPEDLSVETLRVHCSDAGITPDDLRDDETGAPYAYERLSAQDFRLCAVFHDAERTARLNNAMRLGGAFDAGTGCISGRVR